MKPFKTRKTYEEWSDLQGCQIVPSGEGGPLSKIEKTVLSLAFWTMSIICVATMILVVWEEFIN